MLKKFLTILLFGIGLSAYASLQLGEIIHIPPREAIEGNSLDLEAIYTGELDEILDAKILYRLAGQVGFLEEMMGVGEFKLTGILPGEVVGAPGLEYVIVVSLKNGGLVSFPANSDPLSNPQYVAVAAPELEDAPLNIGENFGELVILTPDPGTVIPYGEPMIVAVSLFNLENVDVNSVRVFFNNVDVTAYSLVTTDLITYKPNLLSAGKHNIFIEVSNIYGVRLSSTSWSFDVRSAAQKIFEMDINGNLNINHRQDLINIVGTQIDTLAGDSTVTTSTYTPNFQAVNRADFSTNINFDWAKVKLYANITSKESETLQAQNRYGLKVRTSWLKYAFGDDTAMMNRLALWGKRVRGHNLDLRFKWVNLHVVSGQTARAITGIAAFDSTSSEWNRSRYSFERGLFAIRPSFGAGKIFQMGMFYVHVRDSVNSVSVRPSLWDGSTYSEELFGETGSVTVPFGADSYMLDDSLRPIQYYLDGSMPEDNVVVGSDFKLALDDHRFVVQGSAAFSLYNRNILDGPLTRARLDTFALLADTTLDDTLGSGVIGLPLESIDEIFSGSGLNFLLTDGEFDPANLADFFILNENLTLPVDVESLNNKKYLAALTTIALHFAVKLNYYNHFIHIDYHHVGPGYKALGSPVLRLDGKGWNGWKVTDKIRLLNNMVYLNLGWESHKNNTTSLNPLIDPRLLQSTYSGGVTLNPGQGLPTITMNMKFFTRDNNVDETINITQTLASGVDTVIVVDDRELNESLNSNVNLTYVVKTGPIDNTLSLNIMRSNMDNTVVGQEGLLRASNLFGFNLRSEFVIPLTTTLSIRNNQNQLYESSNPYHQANAFNTYRLGAGYRLFGNNLVIRGSFQYMTFESKKYEDDVLTASLKTQTNAQINTQYSFKSLNVGNTVVKSRVIGSYDLRRYVSDSSDYSDNMVSARFEMTF